MPPRLPTTPRPPLKPRAVSAAERALVRRFYLDGWGGGDATVVRDIGPEGLAGAECARDHARFRKAFPDLGFELDAVERRGDDLVVRWTARGTHRGAMLGVKATGRSATVRGVSTLRVDGGRIASIVVEWDQDELRRQLTG
jgi:predicted ester cyclase